MIRKLKIFNSHKRLHPKGHQRRCRLPKKENTQQVSFPQPRHWLKVTSIFRGSFPADAWIWWAHGWSHWRWIESSIQVGISLFQLWMYVTDQAVTFSSVSFLPRLWFEIQGFLMSMVRALFEWKLSGLVDFTFTDVNDFFLLICPGDLKRSGRDIHWRRVEWDHQWCKWKYLKGWFGLHSYIL